MSSEHSQSHEHELLELLESSSDPRAAFAAWPEAGCPTCRAEFADWLHMDRALDSLRDQEAAILGELEESAAESLSPRLEGHLRDLVRGELAADAPQPEAGLQRPRPRALWRLAWLAAAGVALLAATQWMQRPQKVPDTILHSQSLRSMAPQGAVSSWGAFQWEGDFPSGAWYRVLVRDAEGKLLVVTGDLDQPTWAPDSTTTDTWPERITWDLEVYAFSSYSQFYSATAWLEP